MERISKTRSTRVIKITPRLLTFLAGEISVHFLDKYFLRESLPQYSKQQLSHQVQFIYKFEAALQSYIGKDIGSLEGDSNES